MFYPSEVELAQTADVVLREVEATRPSRVVFDSLSEMRMLAQNPLRYRRQILALKQFFVGRSCTVLLLDDRTAGQNDIQVQSIVHGVITLERRTPEYGVMQRRLQILKMRGKATRPGYHDFVIERGGLRVFPRLVASEHEAEYAPSVLSSGLAELDLLIGGGLDRGTSALMVGPAGTGKSTFATQFSVAAARRGERVAMFLFDEGDRTLRARTQGLGIDLETQLVAGKIHIRQIDPGALSAGQLVQLVRDEVEIEGSRLIVLDSLNGYLNAIPDVRFLIELREKRRQLVQAAHIGVEAGEDEATVRLETRQLC